VPRVTDDHDAAKQTSTREDYAAHLQPNQACQKARLFR
jgi:hypothetical protein